MNSSFLECPLPLRSLTVPCPEPTEWALEFDSETSLDLFVADHNVEVLDVLTLGPLDRGPNGHIRVLAGEKKDTNLTHEQIKKVYRMVEKEGKGRKRFSLDLTSGTPLTLSPSPFTFTRPIFPLYIQV